MTGTPPNDDREARGDIVATLVIFRGDAHHADIQLPGHTVQIGRSPQNDIVLEDHGKGVSRTHAELRFEEGRHVLVDKDSNNGIWVSGSRVTSVVLEPGVVASVGPYRLSIETSEPPAGLAGPEDRTEIAVRPGHQSQSVEELPAPGGPADEDESPMTAPMESKPAVGPAPSETRRLPVVAAAAVLLLGVVGYAAYAVLGSKSSQPAVDWVTAATEMVNAGRCPDALTQHIGPALERNPKDPAALQLKERCPPPPPAPRPADVPPVPSAAELLLNDADVLLASNQKPANKECQAALEKVNEVLAADPANERAVALKTNVDACLRPSAAAKPTAVVWIAPTDPEKGGLPPLPKESPQQHEARVRYAQAKYDEAKTRGEAGDPDGAEKALTGLPANFRDVLELLDSLRRMKTNREAAELLNQARAAAGRNEFLTADDLYRRAKELDPSLSIDKELQDIHARRLGLARKACIAAEVRFSSRNDQETKRLYGEALKLLRAGELCYGDAVERSK